MLIAWRELRDDDYDKFIARSNHTASGGGARDLRWRPHDQFEPVFARLCPEHTEELRGRGELRRPRPVYRGTFAWARNNRVETAPFTYEHPTDARPGEGRITRVYAYPPFAEASRPTDPNDRTFVLLVQDDAALVWPFVIDLATLEAPGWDPTVPEAILECVSVFPSGRTPAGYIDLHGGSGGHCLV